ncbi:hypothetical protein H0H81_009931 [Sphagnurus paluster]|uniref:Protein transport protein SEC31 n=1 Tax=Sphagnurus paluster TaxID=117069 RepID=A0A9P7GNG9_9AGAR|nr:hypothetical protein H0H81_009931 [Sphagnurus paluster]
MKLKEIHRTSTFAWSPTASLPLLATGTVAGALDESFSNESQLEIWAPNFLDRDEYDLGGVGQNGPKGIVKDSSRFNRLAWGGVYDSRPHGVIAAGMENGELALWDPSKILAGAGASESLILRNTTHTGPVRGLDFNPIQTSLLASGGVAGEVYIWDLKDPSKPYTPTPGSRSTKLDEITSVAWNQQVQYVLAGASSTGYTVVWDLRGKREVVALAYGGGAGTLSGHAGAGNGMAMGGRRGMSDIAWHPDNATRLVTASEDDSSPVIMVWDLRNARAPEKILTGHEKGVLSLSWCKQDADLLLSCGKDNRALCWNPQTSEIIGELPSADNWAFQVDWCPRNPDLLATAFFDGTVGIHSIQTTNDTAAQDSRAAQPADGADIFDVPGFSRSSTGGTLSLKQPPKWLRRPTNSSFGFGGQLVTVSNLPSAQGKNQSSVVHIRKVVTEQDLVDRATKLQTAIEGGSDALKTFAEERSGEESESKKSGWKALLSLFKADSRDELVTLLGFSKSEIAARVAEAVENLKAAAAEKTKSSMEEEDITDSKPHEPVVSFAEPDREEDSDEERDEKTPSEISASVTSDTTSANRHADGESTTTVPSLFGEDEPGTPQLAGDFFSTIAQGQVLVPHTNYGIDSSVAATIGSGPSSVSSEILKNNSFRIYPSDESETDRLVTKALVLGDFESAVALCLSSDRFADAILLAVRGGPELLERTQKAYFERRTTSLPYLRLFQSIVTNDLSDIVQNADLQEWQEIFVVLCTFATKDEFYGLAEELGRRLEFQFTVAASSENPEVKEGARDYRQNATLTYLAAARLERLVNIWIDELAEEEKRLVTDETHPLGSQFSAHTQALQSFVEKVTVFRSATKYEDEDLNSAASSTEAKEFKLASLYNRYLEYADLLTTQGLVKEAIAFLKLTPEAYQGNNGIDFSSERARLLAAAGSVPTPSAPVAPTAPASRAPAPAAYSGYSGYVPAAPQAPVAPIQPVSTTQPAYQAYNPSGPVATSYAPTNPAVAPSPYAPAAPSYATQNPIQPYQQSLTQPPHLRQQQQQPQAAMVPPPPRASSSTPSAPPPPKRQENGGWNDAPAVISANRGPASLSLNKPAAITSPFPNQAPSPAFSPSGSPYTTPAQFPPPRPGSVQAHVPPPPPANRMAGAPPHGRPVSRTASVPPPPPARMMSPQVPPMSQQPPPPPPGPYAAPPSRGPIPGQTPPPPGPYNRPPGQQQMGPPHGQGFAPPHGQGSGFAPPPGQASGFAPPPGQGPGFAPPLGQGSGFAPPGQAGSYGHGPSSQQQPQQQQPGPYAPPPGAQRTGPPQPTGPPGAPQVGGPPPPPGGPASQPSRPTARAQTGPPPPKYPPGDRSHIPEYARPAFTVISEHLNRMKQTTPPQQKRLVDDLERRINPLFDALNCETLSKPVVEQLLVLVRAIENHDRPAALAIHVDLLTRGSVTDDIGLWMSGVKQLIMRL